ncbi:MAG: OpgC domain-containing protein [Pseudomonadota bacterium]
MPQPQVSEERSKKRFAYVDGVRGYLIFTMTVGHVGVVGLNPNLNFLTHKPWVVFLSGEGFMLVSGFMTGFMMFHIFRKRGSLSALYWALTRSLKIVVYYLGVLALCMAPALVLGLEGTTADRLFHNLDIFAIDTLALFASGVYRPAFFDILHLYVFYIAITPIFLVLLFSRVWWLCITLSGLLWLLTQYGTAERALTAFLGYVPAIDIEAMGAFHAFAWQLIFFLGCALGALLPRLQLTVRDMAQKINIVYIDILFAVALSFISLRLLQVAGLISVGGISDGYFKAAPMTLLNFLVVAALVVFLISDASLQGSRFRPVLMVLRTCLRAIFLFAPFRVIGSKTLQTFSCSIVVSFWLAYLVPQGTQIDMLGNVVNLLVLMLIIYGFALVLNRKSQKPKPVAAGADLTPSQQKDGTA